ncbi:MAG TPA: metal-dependent transcriptional regulator [Chitinophagales bacterium]|nr:metal-dependent transcriptional regulator [Chitinophagales bacterium]
MPYSSTEENYIKAIFHLSEDGDDNISTNEIARQVSATAASVTDMLKKLKQKKIITYERYQGVRLTKEGDKIAKSIVRKHRLWEVFLVEKLGYSWDKIHDIAEQLEHIQSEEMIDKLDLFLGHPKFDPHGDPIPDASGNIKSIKQTLLSKLDVGDKGKVVGVKDSSSKLLQHLDALGIHLGTPIEVAEVIEFDNSFVVKLGKNKTITLSKLAAQNIMVG